MDGNLPAGTTAVRLYFLSCGHVAWTDHRDSEPATINYCRACKAEITIEHYADQLVLDT